MAASTNLSQQRVLLGLARVLDNCLFRRLRRLPFGSYLWGSMIILMEFCSWG